MTDALAPLPEVPAALTALSSLLSTSGAQADLLTALGRLQRLGLNKTDLTVYVERLRATNAAGEDLEELEERCLVALDLIEGLVEGALDWSETTRAAALIRKSLTSDNLHEAMQSALLGSDLLPPRGSVNAPETVARLEAPIWWSVDRALLRPQRAYFVRARDSPFTSRPAAVLDINDRVVLEALAGLVEERLVEQLPTGVLWPRDRVARPPQPTPIVNAWGSRYVVKADITAFYHSVDHSVLRRLLAENRSLSWTTADAVAATLSAVMGRGQGLPQGPLASDVFASAYLASTDRQMEQLAGDFVRFADDYFFPANSLAEGRATLESLDTSLASVGLVLNRTKTTIMRHDTFESGRSGEDVASLKTELLREHFEALDYAEDAEDAERVLEAAGLGEQQVWNLLYHHTVSVDDLIVDLATEPGEDSLRDVYSIYLAGAIGRLSDEAAPAYDAISRLASEGLAVLSRVGQDQWSAGVQELLERFPQLADRVSEYLVTRTGDARGQADAWLRDRLLEPSADDWVEAWLVYATHACTAQHFPQASVRQLLALGSHPLTRGQAVRVLAAQDAITEAEWIDVAKSLPPAIASDALFATMTDAGAPAWLSVAHMEALGRSAQ